jgi:selenocysteine lyase/cysteine desulfurase
VGDARASASHARGGDLPCPGACLHDTERTLKPNIPTIDRWPMDEAMRAALFPVVKEQIFLAHAAVAALPQPAAEIMTRYVEASSRAQQELAETLRDIKEARATCARFIGAEPEEIALLGPTSLGLSLFANGLPWKAGDEVLCYHGDYPANVYPWLDLKRRGVVVRYLEPTAPGEITPELVEAALTPRTKLVALATCHFFTGYRIDVDEIGRRLHARGVLLSIDGIQSLGAFPINAEHIDFLSADAHKWMLGPLAIGIVYVKKKHFELLRPTLLGAWNVVSPNFITQEEIAFVPTAQRYEPGVLNIAGIYGMCAALELIMACGQERVAARLLELKAHLVAGLKALECTILGPTEGKNASSTTTFRHPVAKSAEIFSALEREKIVASLRHDRAGVDYIRFSAHFYNTVGELDRALEVMRGVIG